MRLYYLRRYMPNTIIPTRPSSVKGYNDEELSLDLLRKITEGLDFQIPDVDFNNPAFNLAPELLELLKQAPTKVNVETLTTRQVGGSGVFDAIMESIKNHLKEEYEANRIIGAEYAKTYTELTGIAIQSAVQFCLQKDSAYWTAIGQQVQVITSSVQLIKAKVEFAVAQAQAHTIKAQYAGAVLDLGVKDAQFELVNEQIKTQVEQTAQVGAQTKDTREEGTPVGGLLGAQTKLYAQQEKLSKEQTEATRAQTSDTRTDGQTVVGSIGKQKDLYSQQIDSYKKDAKLKASKVFSDAWIAMKTTSESLLPPSSFENANVDAVLKNLKTDNGI